METDARVMESEHAGEERVTPPERTIGGAFGGQIVATIISGGGGPTEASFTLAFAVIAGSLLLSILAGLAIPRTPPHERRRVPAGEVAESA